MVNKTSKTNKASKANKTNKANKANISDINSVLQSGLYNITNADIHKEIASRIDELGILYSDYLLLQTRYTLITEIYNEKAQDDEFYKNYMNFLISRMDN